MADEKRDEQTRKMSLSFRRSGRNVEVIIHAGNKDHLEKVYHAIGSGLSYLIKIAGDDGNEVPEFEVVKTSFEPGIPTETYLINHNGNDAFLDGIEAVLTGVKDAYFPVKSE